MSKKNHKIQLPEVEDYNVLHIGEEETHVVPKKFLKRSRRSKLKNLLLALLVLVISGALVSNSLYFSEQLAVDQGEIEGLVDEIGALSQQNFALEQQVLSQEAVLQSIVEDFDLLSDGLSGDADSEALAGLLSGLTDDYELGQYEDLSQELDLNASYSDGTVDFLIGGSNGALMDTIIVASVNEQAEKVTLISIPRDLYINGRKINEYYYYYGIEQLNRMVEAVLGLEMDHFVEVDLDGFVEVVNIIGGIDVLVEEDIYDASYPNEYGGYDPYFIEAGSHHLNGEEALKYARSRKSTSDFDRSRRQQDILFAVKTKMLQLDQVLDMKQVLELAQAGITYTDTDMDVLEVLGYYYDYKDYQVVTSSDHGFVLDSDGDYLYSMINAGGAYILWPVGNNYENIQAAVAELVN